MDTATLLTALIRQLADDLISNDYRLGCPIAAAAYTSTDTLSAQDAAAAVFATWNQEIEGLLIRDGRTPQDARSLAGFMVSAVEGALLYAKAARSTEPLDQAAHHLSELLDRRRPV